MLKKLSIFWVIILIIWGILYILKEAGYFLVVDENPKKSDVIIVLSGGGIDRIEKAVELYENDYADYLIISNGSEDNLYNITMQMGVPNNSIILENHAKSTNENAINTINLMLKYNFKSAIVVSSNYHMRRVKDNYEKANKDIGLNFIYCSSKKNGFDPSRWWTTKENLNITFTEYCKLIGNYLGIHGENAKRILRVFF